MSRDAKLQQMVRDCLVRALKDALENGESIFQEANDECEIEYERAVVEAEVRRLIEIVQAVKS